MIEDGYPVDISTARHLAELLAEDGGGAGLPGDAMGDAPRGFELFQLIGEGASGRVWLARREGGEQLVALKIMKKPLGKKKNARRAWRELDLLHQIRSKCIPAVLDHGMHRGRLFIATEFIDGLPIDAYVESADLDRRRRVELLVKVCLAAGELHNSGIIHRDLKPSNILVMSDGEPVIIDLGIAALFSSDVMQTLTDEGSPIGTPAYMSPEQARGERRSIGIRSDVWSLGAVCCRVLTGETPHDLGESSLYEAVRRVGTLPCRDPSGLDPLMPGPLAAVVLKACALNPADRYASATELAADLRRWLDRRPVEAQPPGPWVRAMRWTTRHPILTTAGLCAAMLLGAVALTGGFLWKVLYEPSNVVTDTARSRVWIESLLHREIAVLCDEPDYTGTVRAQRIDLPPAFGGGWLVGLLAPREWSTSTVFSLIDPGEPDRAFWNAPGPGVFPPLAFPSYKTPEDRAAHGYYDRQFITADVFPEHPGDEIVLLTRGTPDFPGCVRVFGLDTQELFRVWTLGHSSVVWLGGEGVLAIAGPIHRLFTPAWTELDARNGVVPPVYPEGVMIVRPVLGRIDTRWPTYKIPGSATNVERCWVLVQPVTHERGAWARDRAIPGFKLAINKASRINDTQRCFSLVFNVPDASSNNVLDATWVTNSWLEEVRPIEPGNAMEAVEPVSDLISQFGTARLHFEDAPAFDPNAR